MMKNVYLGIAILIFLFSICFILPTQNRQSQLMAQVKPTPTKKQIEQARKLAGEGDKFFRQKSYRMAIDRYQKAALIVQNFPAAYYYKGYSHYSLQEYDQALEDLTTALNQNYPAIEIYKVRWYLYYLKKDYDNALRDAEEVLKLQPSNSNLLIAMGDIYREKNMDKEAVVSYEKAALLVPDNADLHYYIAYTHAKLGDYVQQGVAALKAIQKGTRYLGDAWYLVGTSFQIEKKYKESADAYERAISAKPELSAAYSNLSQVYQILNQLDAATATLKKGIQANPNDGNLYISLTWVHSLSDRHIEAIGAGKKAINLAPTNYMGYTNLCRAYNDVREYAIAIEICNSALKLNPNDGETNFYLGRSHDFLKKPDIATNYYKKAVPGLVQFTKDNPDYSDGFYLLGNAYFAVNQIPNAILAYKKCLELNPTFSKAIRNIGYMYVLNKDKASAREQYNVLVKLDAKLAAELLKDIQGM
jgi:tetratricopeptide (TPR) repeat protein